MGYSVGLQRRRQCLCVSQLAATAGADEPSQLLRRRPPALCRLALHDAQRSQLALAFDDVFNGIDTEGADQFVLEITLADEEPERFPLLAGQVRTEPRSRKATVQRRRLALVAQPPDLQVASTRSVEREIPGDVGGSTDGDDRHPEARRIEPATRREHLERCVVAGALDEHDGSHVVSDRVHGAQHHSHVHRVHRAFCCGGISPMDVSELLVDLYGRIQPLAREVVEGLDTEQLTTQPNDDANPIAWLVWHIARVQDAELAGLVGDHQLWQDGDWAARFGLEPDPDNHGYGHTADEVRAVRPESPEALLEYLAAVDGRTQEHLRALTPADLDRVVDPNWDPPVTLGVRLISVADDGIQHIGQAAYVRGLLGK